MVKGFWRFSMIVMIFGISLGAEVLAQGKNVPSPIVAAPDYFPLEAGNHWTYEITANGAKTLMEYSVTELTETGGQKIVSLESKVNNVTQQTEFYEVKPEGIFTVMRRTGDYQFKFTPSQCLIKYPIRTGGFWEQTGTFSDEAQNLTFTYHLKCKYMAMQNLKVPAGIFKVIKVSVVMDSSDGSHVDGFRYFSPGVGLVKEDFHMTFNRTTRTALLSVLKSYQVKN